MASTETEVCVKSWEKYLPEVKRAQESDKPKSVAMTRKGAKRLFLTFDLTLFKPQKSKNGKGRKKGDRQEPRKHHPPKRKNSTKTENQQKYED